MDTLEERIRKRAYEIWERAGRTGDPQDHWLEAERELTQGSQERSVTAVLRNMIQKLRLQAEKQRNCERSGTDRV